MTVVLLVYRIVLGLLLVPILIGFVGLYSVSQHVDSNNYEYFLNNATHEILGLQNNDDFEPGDEIDFGAAQSFFSSACVGHTSIVLQGIDVPVTCSAVVGASQQTVLAVIRSALEAEIKQDIDEYLEGFGLAYLDFDVETLEEYFELITTGILFFGMVASVLFVLLIFLSVPKYSATIAIGLVGVFAGLPVFFVQDNDLTSLHGSIDILVDISNMMLDSMFQNYLAIFVFGVTLLVVGLVWTLSITIGFAWMRIGSEKEEHEQYKRKAIIESDLPEIEIEE